MSEREAISKELVLLARSLKSVVDDFVVIGGVATFLYDFNSQANPEVKVRTTYTYDVDLAVSKAHKFREEKIHEKIQSLGFFPKNSLIQDTSKPLTKFVKQIGDEQLEIEFLVPLFGSEKERNGKPKIISEVSKHITAQQLRYLDILIDRPGRVSLEKISGELTDREIFLQIPNPANYLLHKFITLSLRNSNTDKQKDAFYIYDFLNRFENHWSSISSEIRVLTEKYKYEVAKTFFDDFRKFFATTDSEGVLLMLEEHKSTYASSYDLSAAQVVEYVDLFIRTFEDY